MVLIETETSWEFATPHGARVTFAVRPGTSDWNTANACNGQNDEYHIPSGLVGWALDVGAHIGAATVPLLIDNPELRAIAIEALPENVAMLRTNLEQNGVAERCVVLPLAAGAVNDPPLRIAYGDDHINQFIGNAYGPEANRWCVVNSISLAEAMDTAGAERIVWCKIDCESCEHRFFDDPMVGLIDYIEGECHPEGGGIARLRALLEPTHIVSGDKDFGPFRAVLR